MKGPWSAAAGLLMLVALDGCRDIAGPDWTHPGTASVQQKRALRYDPYPESDSGPSMDGTRPRNSTPRHPSRPEPAGNWASGESNQKAEGGGPKADG